MPATPDASGVLVVEEAELTDADAVARIHATSRNAGYRGVVPDVLLVERRRERSSQIWSRWLARSGATTFVARLHGHVVGFCTLQFTSPHDPNRAAAEIPAIFVHPDHWRRGIGSALLDRSLNLARERRIPDVVLWVIESNTAARRLYESRGFRPDGRKRVLHEDGPEQLAELLLRRRLELGAEGP